MSTVMDTAANDPRLNVEKAAIEAPVEGVVLPDWNQTELPEGYAHYAYPQIDNNADSGVVIDQNVVPPDERDPDEVQPVTNEEALKLIEKYEPDAEDDWIGARRGADAIDLPQSIYLSPDLTFKDPPDVEEPYDEIEKAGDLPLRPRLREPL